MNLFVLDKNAIRAAKMHCDKHCVKMILEICQLLYTAHWRSIPLARNETAKVTQEKLQPNWAECKYPPYRPTHVNHPCAIWIRESSQHYNWALDLGVALCDEYSRRYKKIHKCVEHLRRLHIMGAPTAYMQETITPPAIKRATKNCPEGCKWFHCAIADTLFPLCAVYDEETKALDTVETYRQYYRVKQANADNWKLVWNKEIDSPPSWYTEGSDIIQQELKEKLKVIKADTVKKNIKKVVKRVKVEKEIKTEKIKKNKKVKKVERVEILKNNEMDEIKPEMAEQLEIMENNEVNDKDINIVKIENIEKDDPNALMPVRYVLRSKRLKDTSK